MVYRSPSAWFTPWPQSMVPSWAVRSEARYSIKRERLKPCTMTSCSSLPRWLLPSPASRAWLSSFRGARISRQSKHSWSSGTSRMCSPSAYRAGGQQIPWTFRVNVGVCLADIAVIALCVIGILPPSSYLAALSALLYLAGFAFLRVFISIGAVCPPPGSSIETDVECGS